MSDWETLAAFVGLTLITILTRALFFISARPVRLPDFVEQGLRYAPLAALGAIVAPGVLADSTGHFMASWIDPRWPGALAGAAWYAWRRDILGTIVVGTFTMLIFRLGFGWSS